MPYISKRAFDSPVILSTFTGRISTEDFHRWNNEVNSTVLTLLPAPFAKLYFILDVRVAEVDFPTILSQMRENFSDQAPDGVDDGMVDILLVGIDAMAKLASEMARLPQFGGFAMPLFRNLEDALAYVAVDQQKLKLRT